MPEHSLQEIFAVTPSILDGVLVAMPEASIRWPNNEVSFIDYAEIIKLRHPLIQNGFCFVDGLNIPVAASSDGDVENAYYNGWTCSHYCSSIMAFAPDGCLIFCSLHATLQ
ncbi:hypothetical protein L915_12842 [Phytophthora nicotianae]|uniref:DDE Tnp4 domain-containing protein n=1 Tax=Phytophthora nicotianae TaxID=4792 RepID=W2GFH8_PHYNI|nr:hypothetical protein L915_12842 [Phytophthora nicotianae]